MACGHPKLQPNKPQCNICQGNELKFCSSNKCVRGFWEGNKVDGIIHKKYRKRWHSVEKQELDSGAAVFVSTRGQQGLATRLVYGDAGYPAWALWERGGPRMCIWTHRSDRNTHTHSHSLMCFILNIFRLMAITQKHQPMPTTLKDLLSYEAHVR